MRCTDVNRAAWCQLCATEEEDILTFHVCLYLFAGWCDGCCSTTGSDPSAEPSGRPTSTARQHPQGTWLQQRHLLLTGVSLQAWERAPWALGFSRRLQGASLEVCSVLTPAIRGLCWLRVLTAPAASAGQPVHALFSMALSLHCCNFAFLKQLQHKNAFTPAWHCCFFCVSADNISGTHTTSTRYGASSDAAPAQRLLALAWEHAEELFGQRVATDWHNAWQHGSGPVGVAGAPGMSGGSMFGVYKQKAR